MSRKQALIYALNDVLRSALLLESGIRRFHALSGAQEWSTAAACLMEAEGILRTHMTLRGLAWADAQRAQVVAMREEMLQRAKDLVSGGLAAADQARLASGIAILHHLRALDEELRSELVAATNLQHHVARVLGTMGKAQRGASTAADPAALWVEIEGLTDAMYDSATRGVLLCRVLGHMHDLLGTSHPAIPFLQAHWKALVSALDSELKAAVKKACPAAALCQAQYPKVLGYFHAFWERLLALGPEPTAHLDAGSALFKALSIFEPAYLIKANSRLAEPLLVVAQEGGELPLGPAMTMGTSVSSGSAASASGAASASSGGQALLTRKDHVERLFRVVYAELEVSRASSRLFAQVARLVEKALVQFASRLCRPLSREPQVITGMGPVFASQLASIEVANALFVLREYCWKYFGELEGGVAPAAYGLGASSGAGFRETMDSLFVTIDKLNAYMARAAQVVLISVTQELENVLLKMHDEDFTTFQQPASPSGTTTTAGGSTNSPYILEFSAKLKWIHREFFVKMSCDTDSHSWQVAVAVRVIDYFVRHLSLVAPLTEDGKLKAAADMTHFEFVVSQWLTSLRVDHAKAFGALRALKALYFADPLAVMDGPCAPGAGSPLNGVYVLHHLLVAAGPEFPLPHQLHKWSHAAYSDWLDEQGTSAALQLIERCLAAYREGVDRRGAREYAPIMLVIERLQRAQLRGAVDVAAPPSEDGAPMK